MGEYRWFIMKTRIISGLIGFILLLAIVGSGGMLLNISIFTLTIVGIYEFHKAVKNIDNIKPISYLNYMLAISFFLMNFSGENLLTLVMFLYIIIILSTYVLKTIYTIQDVAVTILGGLYVPFFFYHMYLLNGQKYIWLVFLGAFATDTFAYFCGMFFGNKKLCPGISPKKTIAGSIGGTIGSIIILLVFSKYFNIGNNIEIIILGIIISVMSQIGDLTASRIKRASGIKDYGKLMPGHGGVLDRFDSILFVAPIVYHYVTAIMRIAL